MKRAQPAPRSGNPRSAAGGSRPGRIGPWRLLDLVQATMPWRGALLGVSVLPEYGPPDIEPGAVDPDQELPHSNIGEHEQRQAIRREAARRFAAVRSAVR